MRYKVGDKVNVRYYVINLSDGGQATVYEDAKKSSFKHPETTVSIETQDEADGYSKFGKFSRRIR